MTNGTVVYFDPAEGHGLISTEGAAQDVAVYQSEVDQARLGQLAAGQKLSFDIEPYRTNWRAINLWATFGDR